MGGRELGLAPPVRAAGDRHPHLVLAQGIDHLLVMGRLHRLPEPTACPIGVRALLRQRPQGLGVLAGQGVVGVIDQIEERNLAQQRDPDKCRIVFQSEVRFRIDPAQQRPGRLQAQLRDRGIEQGRGTAARGQQPGEGHAVVVAKPAVALQLERHVNSPRLECCDQVVELLEGQGVEGIGVVASVVEEAAVGPDGRVEIAQPDEVDARAGQPVGQLVGLVGLEEGRGRDQADPMEPRPAPLLEAEPAVLGRDKARPAGAGTRNEKSRAEVAAIVGDGGTLSQSSVSSSAWNGAQAATSGLGDAVITTSSIWILPMVSLLSNWMTARVAPGGTRTSFTSFRHSKLPAHSNARIPVSNPAIGWPKLSRKKQNASAPPPPRKPWPRANTEIASEPRPSTGRDRPVSTREPDRASSIAAWDRWPGKTRCASLLTIQ